MPKKIKGAKIALLDFSLQKAKMHLGVQVLIEDPEKLEAVRQRCFMIPTFHFCSFAFVKQSANKMALQNFCTFSERCVSGPIKDPWWSVFGKLLNVF